VVVPAAVALTLAGLLALGVVHAEVLQPEAASGIDPKPVLTARRHLAVTANPHASAAALEILEQGGSAVDAAIAAQLVLNLVEPQSSGLGGGGFMLLWEARHRRLRAYDGRETAPAAARPDRFLDDAGNPLPFHDVAVSGRSVGVSGLPALLALAHQRLGRLSWAQLIEPARRLALAGFAVSPRLHHLLAQDRFLRDDPAARALYYEADGGAKPAGAVLRNPDFAALLEELGKKGPGAFYDGPIVRDIVAAAAGHRRGRGDLAPEDFRRYRALERAPLCRWRGEHRICGMPPPSSGGLAVLQILTLLDSPAVRRNAPLSVRAAHRFAEAGRLAFADRGRYLGDPDFVTVPVDELLAGGYLRRRAALIDDAKSMGRAVPGEPVASVRADDVPVERPATTHLSIVDQDGNAVALTSSIEDAFGSRIMVRGMLLNNQLTDFSFRFGEDGRLAANRVEPGKRPLSSMAPTMVFDRQGRLVLVTGSPGGSRIINYVARSLIAVLDWKLPLAQALALPHYGSRNGPTELEADSAAAALRPALEALGHSVLIGDMTSGLHAIRRVPGGWEGAADPRREGTAAGR
jgi:gamma-glutamyltranspeptidase/glutathione hydrolase